MYFLTYLLCVLVACWYLREPRPMSAITFEPNLNRDVDEWNAREFVEEESESFYE